MIAKPHIECKTIARVLAWLLVGSLGTGTDADAAVDPSRRPFYQYYEEAAERYDAGDYAAAIVELKNALQRDPGHLPSRILLGRSYLRAGEAAIAEKELALALALGADEALVLVTLGNALLVQRKHREVLDRIRSSNPASEGGTGVLSIRGQAHLELGQIDEAERSFRAAAFHAPGQPQPLLGLANVMLVRGDRAAAEELVDRAARAAPESAEVWFRKGQVRALAGDTGYALELYDRTLEKAPRHMRARMARAQLSMDLGDAERARDDAEYILGAFPDDAKAALLSAQAHAHLGQREKAAEAFDIAAKRLAIIDRDFLMKTPAALVLAGKVSFVQRDYEAANLYLSRYLILRPDGSSVVRRLAGQARLEIGDPKGAVEALEPLVRDAPRDVEALGLLGDAYLRARMYHQAAEAFARAVELAGDDAPVRTRLALSHMGTGNTGQALGALEEAVRLDQGSMRAGILLTFIHIRRGELEQARASAVDLRTRFPGNPVTENLVGVVARSSGDLDAARAAFARALELEPTFDPATFNLAGLELQAGNPGEAIGHYQGVLERKPRSVRALAGLAEIALSAGRIDDGVALLEKAIALAPAAIEPRVRLIPLYLDRNRHADAMRIAQEMFFQHPENAIALVEYARTQLATGQRDRAVQTLRDATRFGSYSGETLMRVGRLQVSAGDYDAAAWSFEKATSTEEKDDASAALVRLHVMTGDLASARARADRLRSVEPDNPLGHLLAAEVMVREREFNGAVGAYQAALARRESSEAAVGMFEALMSAGNRAAALEWLEQWLSRHPGDDRARRALGLGYIADGQLDRAEVVHDALLAARPDDPLVLNNLARLYQLKKDPRARALARQALDRAPEWPVALDTLGWILVTEGEAAEGLSLLRDAHARSGESPLIRYHVAAALSELGRNREALTELDYLLAAYGALDWIEQVRALRDEVASR